MGQGNCGRMAAAAAAILLGLAPALRCAPAFATDPEPGEAEGAVGLAASGDSAEGLVARPCPTRFDYMVLASFADAPSLLSLSTYHFRSEVSFSTTPLTGLLQVAYKAESGVADCRVRGLRRQTG